MELEAIACNNCGAPLHIPDGVNFVTCSHCGSQLAVKRNESIVYTERLEKLEGQTSTMVDEIRRLKMQQELNQLDDDWESEKQAFTIKSKSGSSLPDEGGAIIGVVVTIIAVIVIGIMAISVENGISYLCLPFLLFLGLAGWTSYDYFSKLNGYNAAQASYYQRRDEIVARYNK